MNFDCLVLNLIITINAYDWHVLFSGLYYGITIAIVSFATGMSVFTLNIHHKGTRGHEIPDIVKTICFKYIAKLMFIQIDLPDENLRIGMVGYILVLIRVLFFRRRHTVRVYNL